MERLERPEKNWKFSADDLKEREYWRRLSGRLRGHDPPDRHAGRALVRRAGG